MQIIPVIDLKNGHVVSAIQGRREDYQSITSTLSTSSLIVDVINGFLSIYPFNTFYIADLNAITHSGSNQHIIDTVIKNNSELEFWIDNGTLIKNIAPQTYNNYKLIIGSENQDILATELTPKTLKNNILSLDFFPEQGYKGPEALLKNPAIWPQDIIIMSLDKVGSNAGPDIDKLKSFCSNYPDKNFIAAGGIRNELDLENLKKTGIKQALMASALHSGEIKTETIKKLISIP